MKTFKIYGEKYPLSATTSVPYECYGYKNELHEEQPKGKVVGYVTMEDGSVIECYKRFNIWIVLVPLLLLLLGAGSFLIYLFYFQPKDITILGTTIQLQEDNLVVTYNGFPSIQNNELSIQYQNGSYPAKIVVKGEGIETQVTNVAPDSYVESIPCRFTTEDGVVEATITIATETSEQTFPIVVEVPENLNGNDSSDGLEGFWHGEVIYGAQ